MAEVKQFERASFREMLKDFEEKGSDCRGAIAIVMRKDGHAWFRISGFTGITGVFSVCGLLDWIRADVLADLVGPDADLSEDN